MARPTPKQLKVSCVDLIQECHEQGRTKLIITCNGVKAGVSKLGDWEITIKKK